MPTQEELQQPSLIERIQRALVLLAYLIELDGDVHVPMYEQFEKELEALNQRETTKDRARQLLLRYNQIIDLPAIGVLRTQQSEPPMMNGRSVSLNSTHEARRPT